MSLTIPPTLQALTDIDQTTQGAGKALADTASNGKPFSWQTFAVQTTPTYTPTDVSGGSVPITVNGSYCLKTNLLVLVQLDITYPVIVSALTAKISLPFTASTSSSNILLPVGYNTTSLAIVGNIPGNVNFFIFYITPSSGSAVTNSQLSNSRIVVTGCYQSSS